MRSGYNVLSLKILIMPSIQENAHKDTMITVTISHAACACGVAGPRLTAAQCVEGMAAGLYEELFGVVVSLINR